jgi:uncharacterized LabA/DUF88 family protein
MSTLSDEHLKIAVFIDFDNVEIGVKTTLGRQFDVGAVLEAIKERGEIITKIAYGDWKRAGDHGRAMSQHAVRLVQRVMTPGGDKNGADITLALDALEMAFTHHHINAFVIVGGDSDFITLVEKLKQYGKKVFVVGGRAFTSQVMQKNCTEFIAYENVARPVPGPQAGRAAARSGRRTPGEVAPLEQALPLVTRALEILADREVSPQLGLLKSTLLQLDSSFSERNYGAGTFREFADKLEQRGFVRLKHSGRTTLVELAGHAGGEAARRNGREPLVQEVPEPSGVGGDESADPGRWGVDAARRPESGEGDEALAEGVALVRAVLADPATPPRWPMYVRQMRQFLRAARPDFDERRYGSLADLLRACQKDGLLGLERDRQGGLRAFAAGSRPSPVPHGWAIGRATGSGTAAGTPEREPRPGDVLSVHAAAEAPLEPTPLAPMETDAPVAVNEAAADSREAARAGAESTGAQGTGAKPRRGTRRAVWTVANGDRPARSSRRRSAKSADDSPAGQERVPRTRASPERGSRAARARRS